MSRPSFAIRAHSGCWFAIPFIALQLSSGAVVSAVGVLGAFFLPAEAERLQETHAVSQLVVGTRGKAVALLRCYSNDLSSPIDRSQVVTFSLDAKELSLEVLSPELRPTCIAVAPGAQRVFVGTVDGSIYSLRIQNGIASSVFVARQPDGPVWNLVCSWDGSVLLSSNLETLHAWTVADGAHKWNRDDLRGDRVVIHPRMRSLACVAGNGEVFEVSIESGATVRTFSSLPWPASGVAISNDGKRVTAVGGAGQVAVSNWETGLAVWPAERKGSHAPELSKSILFSPDDTRVVTIKEDASRIHVWDVETGELLRELRGHRVPIADAVFGKNGRLYSWDFQGTLLMWDVMQPCPPQTVSQFNRA